MVRRFTSRRSLAISSRSSVAEPLALAPVDALLADPVAQGLLDDAELPGHVGHGAVLVDDQGRRVSTELLRDTDLAAGPASAALRSLLA